MVEQGGLVIRMSAETDIGKRPEQQDSVNASLPYIQEDIGVLCALADGVGAVELNDPKRDCKAHTVLLRGVRRLPGRS